MYLGYNTNGFAHHRLEDAIEIVAELGYSGIALTLDVHHLDPTSPELIARTASLRKLFDRHKLRVVVETGARFLLDARRKHQPTLISPTEDERLVRLDFLGDAIWIARELGAEVVSFWSGSAVDTTPRSESMKRLIDGCRQLCDQAADKQVRLAFEPEPGMLIDTMDAFAALHEQINHPAFGLTLDVGHLHCQGELPIRDHVRRWQQVLWNVHIEDMKRGVHDHLMFGEGEMDFGAIVGALQEINYRSGIFVELSRHSHNSVETARKAYQFLQGLCTR